MPIRGSRPLARIIGTGMTRVGKLNERASTLMKSALETALGDAHVPLASVDGLIAIPSLAEPHFMEAHYLGTSIGLLPKKNMIVRTIDTGGAGPISALLEATKWIETGWANVVAIVAGDAVSSLPKTEFLRRADATCAAPHDPLPSPVIPSGYDRVAQWQMRHYGVKREQLAQCAVMMSRQAVHHPYALTKSPHTLEKVLSSPPVAPVTSTLECARRSDGGAAVILASAEYAEHVLGRDRNSLGPVVLGGGEASGPLYPPSIIDETMFSCEEATRMAYDQAQLSVGDIDFFGLYDCFPICLIRAIEAVGLAKKGEGGDYIEDHYNESNNMGGKIDPHRFPINTHGGLLGFAAPWETPAMYNIIEAVAQLTGKAANRQVPHCRRSLVYGNGGIFSASAVAILGDGKYHTIRSRDKRYFTGNGTNNSGNNNQQINNVKK